MGKRQNPHVLVNTIIAEEHGSLESVEITPRHELNIQQDSELSPRNSIQVNINDDIVIESDFE